MARRLIAKRRFALPSLGAAACGAVAVLGGGALFAHAAAGGDPFAPLRRPLHIPRIAAGSSCPVSRPHAVSRAFGPALGGGPVYAIGFDSSSALSFENPPSSTSPFAGSEWGGTKVLWVARRSYNGPILIQGRQLDGPNEVRFDLGGGDPLRELALRRGSSIARSRGGEAWRQFPSHTRLRAGGCYAYQIDGTTFSRVVVFRARPAAPVHTPGGTDCRPPSPLAVFGSRLPEAWGTAARGSVWALFFPPSGTTWKAGEATFEGAVGKHFKIVFRVTGSGEPSFTAHGPDEATIAPDWGPTAHGASSWARPGQEWGVGFTFTVAGCWRLHGEREGASGDVWIVVR